MGNQNNEYQKETCNYCGKYSRRESKCRNKNRDEENANVACEDYEIVF